MISSLLFNLLLVSFAMADEMAASAIDNTWKYGTSGGVLGFIVLILDIMVFSTFLSPPYQLPLHHLFPLFRSPIPIPQLRTSFTPQHQDSEDS
jgi:hypothetical protein